VSCRAHCLAAPYEHLVASAGAEALVPLMACGKGFLDRCRDRIDPPAGGMDAARGIRISAQLVLSSLVALGPVRDVQDKPLAR